MHIHRPHLSRHPPRPAAHALVNRSTISSCPRSIATDIAVTPASVFISTFAPARLAIAPVLDKRWHEVVLEILPYVFVLVAMMRMPTVLRKVAERMKDYGIPMRFSPWSGR